jgi:hypothetical protein
VLLELKDLLGLKVHKELLEPVQLEDRVLKDIKVQLVHKALKVLLVMLVLVDLLDTKVLKDIKVPLELVQLDLKVLKDLLVLVVQAQ